MKASAHAVKADHAFDGAELDGELFAQAGGELADDAPDVFGEGRAGIHRGALHGDTEREDTRKGRLKLLIECCADGRRFPKFTSRKVNR